METADILTMILFGLIVAACWVMVPGLIAGWLLRESGRSFWSGFALGAVCGPLGIAAALVFVSVSDVRGAHGSSRRRAARTHYDVPLLGRLHASTAWTLAGLATFMCVWVLGGIGYEVFYRHPHREEAQRASVVPNGAAATTAALEGGAQTTSNSSGTQTTAAVKNDSATQPRPSMLGPLSSQTTRTDQLSASASPVAAPPSAEAVSLEGVELTGVAPSPQPSATAHAGAESPSTNAAVAPPKPAASSRAAIISELTSGLAARGYRAHATVSGDARTSTLSISCATLTRAAGNQLLGNSRTREALKAAGIRIVVMINGQESWTYML